VNVCMLDTNSFLIGLDSELNNFDEKPILDSSIPQRDGSKSILFLDFGKVAYINGLGATMLIKLVNQARQRNQKVVALGVNSHYRSVLKLIGLERVMPVYFTAEEALASVQISSSQFLRADISLVQPRDILFWANPVINLEVPALPPQAINRNVQGRGVAGPVQGFGQLWQKRYHLLIDKAGQTPESIIAILKQNLPGFQPAYNRFYPSPLGIQPGEVVAIDSSTPGGPVSTGVLVMFSDATSFTFITPYGHPESGWVTFSASTKGSKIEAQILGLARANDPVYEAAFRAIGSEMQVRIWTHVLNSLAKYLGVPEETKVEPKRIDAALQWSQTPNLWYNAQIRTLLDTPLRWLRKAPKKSTRTS
jgi:anti-anti-sigma regulatory factor